MLSKKEMSELMPGYAYTKPRQKSTLTELSVHSQVCKYLKLLNVMFISDFGAGIKLSKGMAQRQKLQKSDHAWPDIFVAEPRGKYHGLFLELKRDKDALYNKDGSYKKSDHIDEQRTCIDKLSVKGYLAGFVCGFNEAKYIIDDYLRL